MSDREMGDWEMKSGRCERWTGNSVMFLSAGCVVILGRWLVGGGWWWLGTAVCFLAAAVYSHLMAGRVIGRLERMIEGDGDEG